MPNDLVEIKKKMEMASRIYKKICEAETSTPIATLRKAKFYYYSKLILTTTTRIIGEVKDDNRRTTYSGICGRCGNEFSNSKTYNIHIRKDGDCSIYYKLKYLTTAVRKRRNTLWGDVKDLEKRIKYH